MTTGESFWSIAARILETRNGSPPTAAAVVPLWHALIDANRAGLPEPNNPDLLYVGTVLTIPP